MADHPPVAASKPLPGGVTDLAPARLLLVDDEASLREPLGEYLAKQGFVVSQAANAGEARELLKDELPDLVLLDIMMPGEDGLSLCRHLAEARAVPTDLPDRARRADRPHRRARDRRRRLRGEAVRAARAGRAHPQRAAARRARWGARAESEIIEFEGWRLDPLKRRLIDPDGAVVAISSVEFRLLMAFLDHPRQVLDRDRLLDMVQGREAHLFDRAVDNQVSRLRRKIEVDSRNPQLIQTVWGGGYMLAADVKRTPA